MKAPEATKILLSKNKKQLTVGFDNKRSFTLQASYLRQHSPSPEKKGHGIEEKNLCKKGPQVKIEKLQKIGQYAIQITFSDQHTSNDYTWDYLYQLGMLQDSKIPY